VSADLTLISAATVARLKDGSVLRVQSPYIVTPSAAELADKRNIRIENIVDTELPDQSPPIQAPDSESEPHSLASYIDSTLLASDATPDQIAALCKEAAQHRFAAVCVNPIFVELAAKCLADTRVSVCAVSGFPLGSNSPTIKAAEARLAVEQGAGEIDMVMPVGLLRAGDYPAVKADIAAVRKALGADTTLKTIIEASLLTDEEKIAASIIAVEAGANFVKTGTGFAGPATIEDVRLIRQAIGDRARIKAAGGIRDRRTAEALIAAGADRIGTSSAITILS